MVEKISLYIVSNHTESVKTDRGDLAIGESYLTPPFAFASFLSFAA